MPDTCSTYISRDQRMVSETMRRRILGANPQQSQHRHIRIPRGRRRRRPLQHPCRWSSSSRSEYLAIFLALAFSKATQRFSNSTVTSHMTTFLEGSCLMITRSDRSASNSPLTPSTRWLTRTTPERRIAFQRQCRTASCLSCIAAE